MRGAAGFRALSTSVVLGIAWVSLRVCLAEHQPGGQAFLQETFKAVLLKPRPSSLSVSTIASAETTTTTPTAATALDRSAPDTKEREAEADALAADLVQSLSEALLLLDRQWVQQQQQQQQPGPGPDIYSPPHETDYMGAEAVRARRESLWTELGLPLLSAGEDTLGAAGAGADTGLTQAVNTGKTAGKPAKKTAGEPAAAGPAALAAAAAVGAAGVGEDDTSDASATAEAAVLAVEGAGRQSLRGDGGQPYIMVTAAVAAAETTAEGFQDANWEALGSRGLAAEEPLPAFGDGGAGGGVVAAAAACAEGGGGEEDFLKIDSVWVNIALTFVCVVCAGLAAGLTMGLLSIEPLEMAIKQRSGTAEEQRQAKKILPLVSQHHFLLVTLLLFNSLANEALPIFLGNLVPSWLAVILSVSLVLFFGEIVPSAVFTGKGRLAIAAGMSWFVSGLMLLLGPVAWPIAWTLDRVLGIEGLKRYNRAEIAALVEVQHELSTEDVTNLPLHADEVSIVNGVLQTAVKSVTEAMITMDKVFCLSRNEKLSANTMADIMAAGYSRVLVYEGEDTRNIRGYLQVKKLIVLDPDDERDISTLMLRIPVVVSPTKSLLDLLNTFQTGRSHLALISHSPAITLESLKHGVRLEGAARPVGIITLEDIIEEILQEEIMDESDRLTQFIEDRAKDTLLRFTRMRQQRRIMGRYAAVAISSPSKVAKENSLLLQLSNSGSTPGAGGSGPPSPFFDRSDTDKGAGSDGSLPADPPAAPGVGERARLLSNTASRPLSGSHRRLLPGGKPSKKGGVNTTVAEAMMAAAQRTRESDDAAAAAVGTAAGVSPAGGDPSRRPSLFKQPSIGSVNNNGYVSGRDDSSGRDSDGGV